MAPIPKTIPGRVVAGDSLSWSRSFDDYPVSAGWALSYTLIGAAVYSFNAVADGEAFLVTVTSTDSGKWGAGTYRLAEILTNGDQRVTVGTTTLIVAPDPATAAAGGDVRTHAEKMLANIEAWLESRAPTAGALEINGRKIQNYPLAELLSLRDKYAAMVKREQAVPGSIAGTRILVRL